MLSDTNLNAYKVPVVVVIVKHRIRIVSGRMSHEWIVDKRKNGIVLD